MDKLRLKRLLSAKSLAFIGGRGAAAAIARCRNSGFSGALYLVNSRENNINGEPCFPTVHDLPTVPDAAFIGTNAESTISYVKELSALGVGGAVCYASGFAESGRDDLQKQLLEAAGEMAILGPNCFGLLDFLHQSYLWPVAFGGEPVQSGIAILTQSGNFAYNISMLESALPISYLVSLGNQAQVGFAEILDAMLDDDRVTAIGLHIESLGNPLRFLEVAKKALDKNIPIVAIKSGRSELAAEIALSHTSSLAGSDTLYSAFFKELNILRVDSPTQMMDVLMLAVMSGTKVGRNVAALACSGGDAGFIADAAATNDIALPSLKEHQESILTQLLPSYANITNPLDFTTAIWAQKEPLITACNAMLGDKSFDMGFLALDYPSEASGERPEFDIMLQAFANSAQASNTPSVVSSIFSGLLPKQVKTHLFHAGVAAFDGIERAFYAMGVMATYHDFKGLDDITLTGPLELANAISLSESDSKKALEQFGLSTSLGKVVAPEQAGLASESLPAPYVLKVVHEDIAHKTDVGGVVLNLENGEQVQAAADNMVEKLRASHSHLEIDKVLVEPMLDKPLAELIVGVARDAVFGLYLVIGSGGVWVELLKDSQIVFLPASASSIHNALQKLAIYPLMQGYRGAEVADINAVISAIQAVANYASEHSESLLELDVNPLMVYSDKAVAVDALIRMQEN